MNPETMLKNKKFCGNICPRRMNHQQANQTKTVVGWFFGGDVMSDSDQCDNKKP